MHQLPNGSNAAGPITRRGAIEAFDFASYGSCHKVPLSHCSCVYQLRELLSKSCTSNVGVLTGQIKNRKEDAVF